ADLLGVYIFTGAATPPLTTSNPTVNQESHAATLPAGAQTYLYGQVTGGGAATAALVNGSVKTVTDTAGFLSAGLAVSSSNTNSFTTSGHNYSVSGIGVSNYTSMQAL